MITTKQEVYKYCGIELDLSRDNLLTEQGLRYLTTEGFYKKPNETTPQETFARAAACYSFGDSEFAKRIYDYASKQWFAFASPVLSNAVAFEWPVFTKEQFQDAGQWLKNNVKPSGMPISCFLNNIHDSKEGLTANSAETKELSMAGGGVGVFMGNRSPDTKSTGVMAHAREYDAVALAYKQAESRRGSIALYLDIDHPEVMSFLGMRDPTGGDSNKKCFNLNHGLNITDKFMRAVIKGEKYPLIDPKHGNTGQSLDAREVWEKILETRKETGEPYLLFIDTVNKNLPKWVTKPTYKVTQSNLCVVPETKILTREGYVEIEELSGQTVDTWNGQEWSEVTVVKTGDNQEILKVQTTSGYELECTPYHKWYVFNGYGKAFKEVRTKDLKVGDKLIKFNLPVIEGYEELPKAYINGFYSGDGCLTSQGQRIYLYGEKRKLRNLFTDCGKWTVQDEYDREYAHYNELESKFFVPNAAYSVKSRLDWLAGFLDADGCVYRNGTNEALTASSVNKVFLKEVQLMLQTLGVSAKVVKMQDAGLRDMPLNDGSGNNGEFSCQASYRLLITSFDSYKLLVLGLNLKRLQIIQREPQRDAKNFVVVESITNEGRLSDTYCFTEKKRGMGMFNGILTGQCSEITLMTSLKRSAVCCLSSLNLERYEEWKDTSIIEDLVRLLDNVLEYFLLLAPPSLSRAIHSATKERAIGLGGLGFHSLLQSKMIPIESAEARRFNIELYKGIKEKAVKASLQLGKERGEVMDCMGTGMRNSHLTATAPNASSASIVGASPSIEPWKANVFLSEGRAGSMLIKNKHLEEHLEKIGKNTKKVWDSILMNEGSVQHLDFLDAKVKDVFKTAMEIDQMKLVTLVADRTPFICQSQSFNVFINNTMTAQELSDIHLLGWKKGIKSFYYCRGDATVKANVGTGREAPLNAVIVEDIKQKVDETLPCCEG